MRETAIEAIERFLRKEHTESLSLSEIRKRCEEFAIARDERDRLKQHRERWSYNSYYAKRDGIQIKRDKIDE